MKRANALRSLHVLYSGSSKACLTFVVEWFKQSYQAINYIYQSLQDDRSKADTSAIIQRLNEIVSDAIDIEEDKGSERIFDISKIDFDALSKEFAKSEKGFHRTRFTDCNRSSP